jgi:hypothetical protein
MAKNTQTTYTFQVTFVAPKGMNIPTAREHIRDALLERGELELKAANELRVHLTNKEVKYG